MHVLKEEDGWHTHPCIERSRPHPTTCIKHCYLWYAAWLISLVAVEHAWNSNGLHTTSRGPFRPECLRLRKKSAWVVNLGLKLNVVVI